ncbi:PilZ domain-containing protein [Spirobacillus cienkowskii]|jgi:c-di-GMP-binding flagellar brake protein YcgR|uniref:PilZ domain-containing protein n=1 Tax=Spirobacillus cienkowskii TaxID=495820 RepID=A0A369KW91_9BACT|nr:MAG: PilZ domain-containing protein [Spirobacillus cienkowskii]
MTKSSKDKRKSIRHEVELVVSISINQKIVAKNNVFKNLSESGCLVSISNKYNFKVGDKVTVLFEDELLINDLVFEPIEAVVRHITTNELVALVGFEFINVSLKNKKTIKSIIDNKFLIKKFPKAWQISR